MEAYRRHIVIDNIGKVIYIQVMESLDGNLKSKELWDMANGQWHRYVHETLTDQLQDAIANGYSIFPMKNFGAMNEEYYIIQITATGLKELIS